MIEIAGVLYPEEVVVISFESRRTSGAGDVLEVRSAIGGDLIGRHTSRGDFNAWETYRRLWREVVKFQSLPDKESGEPRPLFRDADGRGWYSIDTAPGDGAPIMLRDQAGTQVPARWHRDGYWADADDKMILGQPGIWAWSPAPSDNTEGYE